MPAMRCHRCSRASAIASRVRHPYIWQHGRALRPRACVSTRSPWGTAAGRAMRATLGARTGPEANLVQMEQDDPAAYLRELGQAGNGPHDVATAALMLSALDHAGRPLEPYRKHLNEIAV